MTSMRAICVAMGITALTGCGGGGGGSDPGTALTLTAENAVPVAADVYGVLDLTSSLGDLGTELPTGALIDGPGNGLDLVKFTLAQYLHGRSQSIPAHATGATMEMTENCPGGGTVSFAFTDANHNGANDPGDSFSVTFDQCASDGPLVDGSFSAQVLSAAGDPDGDANWSIGLTVNFQNLSFSDVEFSGGVTGGFSLNVAVADDTTTIAIAGDSLSLSGQEAVTLSDFNTQVTRTLDDYVYDASGTAVFSGQSVSYDTTTAFSGVAPGYPHAGVLRVDGAGQSSLTLTAVDSTNVQVAVDKNGDGTAEQTIETTWAELGS